MVQNEELKASTDAIRNQLEDSRNNGIALQKQIEDLNRNISRLEIRAQRAESEVATMKRNQK